MPYPSVDRVDSPSMCMGRVKSRPTVPLKSVRLFSISNRASDSEETDDEDEYVSPPVNTGRTSANVMCAEDGGRKVVIRK